MAKDKKDVANENDSEYISDRRGKVARAVAVKPEPSNQRRRRQPRQRIGVKNI